MDVSAVMSGLVSQALPFVHPALAGAAVALGLIPVLVHFLSRRRHVRVPWAAMTFLLAAHRRSARRLRLEQSLLLLTRVLLIVLFGLAVARPYVANSGVVPWRTAATHRVLLLDNSLSMSAKTPSGPTRFELAKRYARGLLDSFPPADAVSLVTLAAPADAVIARPSYDRRFVRDRLRALEPTQRGTDSTGAIDRAIDILRSSQAAPGNRAVYLISDFPRDGWHADRAPQAAGGAAAVRALRRLMALLSDPSADLHVARVASMKSVDNVNDGQNVALTRLEAQSILTPGHLGVHLPVSIVAEVTNFGTSTAEGLLLQVHRDEQIVRREALPPIQPGQAAVTTVTTTFPRSGTHLVEARLAPTAQDALAQDNARFLSLDVKETTPVLLVDGRPGATSLDGEAGFLALALAPSPGSPYDEFTAEAPPWPRLGAGPSPRPLVRPKVITVPQLAEEPLEEYDLLALCNVPLLSAENWKRIETFTDRGKGLLIFGGDLVDVENYNRLGYAAGAGLLPGELRPASTPETRGADSSTLGLRLTDVPHPLVAAFASRPDSSLFAARVRRYLPLKVDPRPMHRGQVVLQMTNGDPAMVTSPFGSGRVLLCTTTANLNWTNLPAKGDFVSLMMRAVAYLAPVHGAQRNILVGGTIQEPLTPQESSFPLRLTMLNAGGRRTTEEPALTPHGDSGSPGLALTHGPLERTGPVRVSIGSRDVVFAVNVDPTESDLAVMSVDELWAALGGKVHPIDINEESLQRLAQSPLGVDPQRRTTELGAVLVYLVLALLLLEMWMARSFGAPKGKR